MIHFGQLPQAVEAAITNGCGPDGLAWLIPDWNEHIYKACQWHDLQWNAGGNEQQRLSVDRGFFIRGTQYMVLAGNTNRADYGVLYVYYKAIQEVSHEWWDYRDKPRSVEEIVVAYRNGELDGLRNARSALFERVEKSVRSRVQRQVRKHTGTAGPKLP